MKKMIQTVVCILALGLASSAVAQEKMKWEDYLAELGRHKQREEVANQKIAVLEADIADLKNQIAGLQGDYQGVWSDVLSFLGITAEDFAQYQARLSDFTRRVRGFEAQYNEDIPAWDKALQNARNEFKAFEQHKAAFLPRMDAPLYDARQALRESMDRFAAIRATRQPTTYTVQLIPERRDCLWRIAEYSEIYGDPFRWPAIYSANKNLIKDPDLIYPGQTLVIPR